MIFKIKDIFTINITNQIQAHSALPESGRAINNKIHTE